MPFPATRRELKLCGYDYLSTKTCPCGARMELWHTPRDQTIPMNLMPDDDSQAVSHWATCAKASQFRRQKSPPHPSAQLPMQNAQAKSDR